MASPARFARLFARYAELVPDYPAFLAAVAQPAPVHVRVNTLKAAAPAVRTSLSAVGLEGVPEPWYPDLLRLSPDLQRPVGTTLAHALGHLYVQSASSALAALAVGAQPGDRVLDLCAAPGSKATLVAQQLGDCGAVVANEPNPRRIRSLVANLERLGVTCALVTAYAGQNFPSRQQFQRVLVDAPCTGEGTWRGPAARPRADKPSFRAYLRRQQAALLRAGYDLLAPGGVLVYSTCTYAPEENEGVVGPFLVESGAAVLPLDVPEAWGAPGLTRWQDESFPEALAASRRLYPHRFDSEGFYVARLGKPG